MSNDPIEKETPVWKSWFENAASLLDINTRELSAKKLEKQVLDRRAKIERHRQAHRARLTREFLASEFWTDYLKPMLDKKIALKPWTPGDSLRSEDIANAYLMASGRTHLGLMLLKAFEDWMRDGDEATKKLAEDEKVRQQISELRI